MELIEEDEHQALETVLNKAVQTTVSHLQVFDALQKIRGDYDGLLRTLIKHKDLVLGGDDGDRTPLMTALMRSPGFLDLAAAAIERKDPEMRLLSTRLPPYNLIAPRKLEAVPKLHIEESFVDDLRGLSVVEYVQDVTQMPWPKYRRTHFTDLLVKQNESNGIVLLRRKVSQRRRQKLCVLQLRNFA